jgi:hypothetical protein
MLQTNTTQKAQGPMASGLYRPALRLKKDLPDFEVVEAKRRLRLQNRVDLVITCPGERTNQVLESTFFLIRLLDGKNKGLL